MATTVNVTSIPISYDINLVYRPPTQTEKVNQEQNKYEAYLPHWDPVYFSPCPPFDFIDPASRADPSKPLLFGNKNFKIRNLTPKMGSEISGIQLSQLTEAEKDELALIISERKCVVFTDQDFVDIGAAAQQDFMAYFGKPNYQPITGTVEGFPGFHIIYRDGNKADLERFFQEKATSTLWHHDVSFERQPPGYVLLCNINTPPEGGDTVFASTTEAYNRLSPAFRKMLENVRALHSSEKMINYARNTGGLVRKEPITSSHPVIRVHPVTGERAIFVNSEFITRLEGMKMEESELLVKFLVDHVVKGHDFQVRLQWKPRSVVMFDNRTTLHTATVDYDITASGSRHLFRLASMAEEPIPVQH
ncbi:hypothetical protein M422DRAFT_247028 [Sphaerobolus stellatus SS14]|nr:hypothetical protein M422DRAFT_247028 [Sphaerobolus stellatus SS14]